MVSSVFFGTIEQASRNLDLSGNEDLDLQIEAPAERLLRMLSSFILIHTFNFKKNVFLQGGWIIV